MGNMLTKPVVTISTLGGFRISSGGKSISESINRSNKMWSFLAYMILHRDKRVSHDELVEALWPNGRSANPVNSLKTLVYRVRTMLSQVFGKDFNLIESRRGSYVLSRKYDYKVDIDEFQSLCKNAEKPDTARAAKKQLFSQAIDLYENDLIPRLANEVWIIPISLHLHNLFVSAVKAYTRLLFDSDDYQQIVDVCKKAAEIEPYDEDIHSYIIRAYHHLGDEASALEHYSKATDILYRNFGVAPSEKLRSVYREIMKSTGSLETDLGVITEQMSDEDGEGAFVCDYGFFQEFYALESRRSLREGTCAHVCLFTISTDNGALPPLEVLNNTVENLIDIAAASLRRSDIISRYSGAQIIILLPSANFEDSENIIKRIEKSFHRIYPKSKMRLSYKLQQVEKSR